MVLARMFSEPSFAQVVGLFKKATGSRWSLPSLGEMREALDEFGHFELDGGMPGAQAVRLVFRQKELGLEVLVEPEPCLPEAALPQAQKFAEGSNKILEALLK